MVSPPAAITSDATVAELITRMADAGASSVLIVGEGDRLIGIVTEEDVAKRIALRCDGSEPVNEFMTSPVRAISQDDYLYYAIATMRRFGWHHMPVVDSNRRPVGLISLSDALAVAAEQSVRQIERVTKEGNVEALRQIKAAQVELADELIQDSVPAHDIQALLTHINKDIHRRIIEATLAAMREDGWGDPPLRFAAIIMGSGGRGENFLNPDQDNGFILDDYPDNAHKRIDPYFIELADRMTRDLDAVGIPFCDGHVMATNPLWRKTKTQWRRQLALWGRKRIAVVIREADIFFDFQHIYGEIELPVDLRHTVAALIKASPSFLKEMHDQESPHLGVALSLFGRLRTEKRDPEHEGKIDLKYSGTLPLVQCIRLLALREGIEETSTLGRIHALHDSGILDKDRQDYLSGAFHHICALILRQQIADSKAGKQASYYVDVMGITERERNLLVDSLKAIADLRKRINEEFTADIF